MQPNHKIQSKLSGTLQLSPRQWQRLIHELDLLIADIVPTAPVHAEVVGLRTAVHQAHYDARRSQQLRQNLSARRAANA